LFSINTSAEIYKWVDSDGRVHYGDSNNKSNTKSAEKIDVKLNTYKRPSVQEKTYDVDKVVMYSTSWCGYCRKARNYFKEKNISFVEYDIERDLNAKKQYDGLGGRGVPVILYKDQRINGFSEKRFRGIYPNGA